MKKVTLCCVLVVLFFSLIGCSSNVVGNGVVQIAIDSKVSKGIQAIPMEVSTYKVLMKNSSGNVFLDTEGKSCLYEASVPAGSYTIEVEALNENGDVIGSGLESRTILEGKSTTITVVVKEFEGDGTLSIAITANEGYRFSCSIENPSGKVFNFKGR